MKTHRITLLVSALVLVGCGATTGTPTGDPSSGGTNASGGSPGTGGSETGGSSTSGGSLASGGTGGTWPTIDGPSAALIKSLSLGWNLGNSLDAPNGETTWGNPTVTQSLLQAVADNGFDLVRIPVTWSLHMGPGPDYIIDPAWLARVEEVVGYAINSGLHAIINLHHDGADDYTGVEWLTLTPYNAAVQARFVAVWTQIADHFSGYGEHLIFESMNEIHDGYGDPDPQYFNIINELNQVFVDTVRASGGANPQRHLVVPGYNTNIDHTMAGFELPNDPTPDRLILSVHYYDPWKFAGSAETQVWGQAATSETWGQEGYVVHQFNLLKTTYVDKGIPVIIGEYGAVHQSGYEDYRRYYMEYVTKAAADRDIVPVYWDNGSPNSGAEAFGLFNRTNNTIRHPTIHAAMVRAVTSDYTLQDIEAP